MSTIQPNACSSLSTGVAYGLYIVAVPATMLLGLVRTVVAAVFSIINYWKEKQAELKGGGVFESDSAAWREAWKTELKRGAMEFLLPLIGPLYLTYKDLSYKESFNQKAPGLLGFSHLTYSLNTFS